MGRRGVRERGDLPCRQRGGALLRTSVMATHEREHLDRALEAFERVLKDVPEPPEGAPPLGPA